MVCYVWAGCHGVTGCEAGFCLAKKKFDQALKGNKRASGEVTCRVFLYSAKVGCSQVCGIILIAIELVAKRDISSVVRAARGLVCGLRPCGEGGCNSR